MRILVAEDEPGTRHLLKSLLLKWRYQVVVAQDGNEAWRLLQQEDAPMLAILDWMMPGLDGIQICREVRKLGEKILHLYPPAHRQKAETGHRRRHGSGSG